MKLSEYILNLIEDNGINKKWVADKAGIKYRTFLDKLDRNSFTGEELLVLGKILKINLNKLKEIL